MIISEMNTPIANLGIENLEDFLCVTKIAFKCNQVDELRNNILCLLQKIFKSHKSNFILANKGQFDFNHPAVLNIEDKYMTQYREYYSQFDPFSKFFFNQNYFNLTTDQIIPFNDFTKSDYYNDFIKPQSIFYQMIIFLRSTEKTLGAIALFRPKDEVNFSSLEKGKAELMAPYLAAALERVIFYINQEDPIIKLCDSLKKYGLTQRETEVAYNVCEGLTNREIANKLFISEHTVITHLKSIYKKLGINNRTSLIHRVIHQDNSDTFVRFSSSGKRLSKF